MRCDSGKVYGIEGGFGLPRFTTCMVRYPDRFLVLHGNWRDHEPNYTAAPDKVYVE